MKFRIQQKREFPSRNLLAGTHRGRRAKKLHRPPDLVDLHAAAAHFHLRRQRGAFSRRGIGRWLNLNMHIANQPQLALLGLIDRPHSIAAAIRKRKFHRLHRLGLPGGAFKRHSRRVDVNDVWAAPGIRGRACRILRALQFELHFPLALNAAVGLRIAAALRMDHVIAIPILPKHLDLHVFQQADVLAAQIRRLRRFQIENRPVAFHFLET